MFHTSVYELKPINEIKVQQKYKIQTAKMRRAWPKSVIRRKTSQEEEEVYKNVAAKGWIGTIT